MYFGLLRLALPNPAPEAGVSMPGAMGKARTWFGGEPVARDFTAEGNGLLVELIVWV